MISGAHVIVHSKDPEADRAFFRDVLGFHSVDAGHGWLIFRLPPSEGGIPSLGKKWSARTLLHVRQPEIRNGRAQKEGVPCSAVHEERWGLITRPLLPGGGEIGLYQPKHPTAQNLGRKAKRRTTKRHKR
jgi:catechol 2,3-dioxygenase-like lactoylglutathione lyase family enzyme